MFLLTAPLHLCSCWPVGGWVPTSLVADALCASFVVLLGCQGQLWGAGSARGGGDPTSGTIMLFQFLLKLHQGESGIEFRGLQSLGTTLQSQCPAGKHVRSLGKISCAAACCGMLRHASTCTCGYLHLWEIELTNKRQHAQHCWTEFITFTIRIVCSGFVDIHHSQMAQSVVAHMQTILCLDVAHQTERSLDMASRAWSSDKENSNGVLGVDC